MEFIRVKQLIHKVHESESWFGITHNCNIYRGCNHGCIYCDSRSSCYKINDFDTVKAKQDADIMIERELSGKRKKGVLGLGGMNDPYNPFEKTLKYTRSALKSCLKHGFGVVIITKSTLVLRDIDILREIQKQSNVLVLFTITTSDDRLQKRIERNCSTSTERFLAIKELRNNHIHAGIAMMPILPFINDTIENITGIIEKAKEHDAQFIYPSFGVTLRDNQRQYFLDKIGPVLRKQYIDTFQNDYVCPSIHSKELKKHFKETCEKNRIFHKMNDIIKLSSKHKNEQIQLF
jgi:DNA repair photolyase